MDTDRFLEKSSVGMQLDSHPIISNEQQDLDPYLWWRSWWQMLKAAPPSPPPPLCWLRSHSRPWLDWTQRSWSWHSYCTQHSQLSCGTRTQTKVLLHFITFTILTCTKTSLMHQILSMLTSSAADFQWLWPHCQWNTSEKTLRHL